MIHASCFSAAEIIAKRSKSLTKEQLFEKFMNGQIPAASLILMTTRDYWSANAYFIVSMLLASAEG